MVGGVLGGVVAADTSWALNTFVLALRVPAEPIRPFLDAINSIVALLLGLPFIEARRRPRAVPLDELDSAGRAASRPPTGDRRGS